MLYHYFRPNQLIRRAVSSPIVLGAWPGKLQQAPLKTPPTRRTRRFPIYISGRIRTYPCYLSRTTWDFLNDGIDSDVPGRFELRPRPLKLQRLPGLRGLAALKGLKMLYMPICHISAISTCMYPSHRLIPIGLDRPTVGNIYGPCIRTNTY